MIFKTIIDAKLIFKRPCIGPVEHFGSIKIDVYTKFHHDIHVLRLIMNLKVNFGSGLYMGPKTKRVLILPKFNDLGVQESDLY